MILRCPKCNSHGVYKIKKRLLDKILSPGKIYFCIDCDFTGTFDEFSKSPTAEAFKHENNHKQET